MSEVSDIHIVDKEKAILRFFRIVPDYTNERIAEIFRIPLERVVELRKQFDANRRCYNEGPEDNNEADI